MPDAPPGAPPPRPPPGPVVAMGFDFGLKRIGVASGDTLTGRARPLAAVASHAGVPDWTGLDRLVRQWEPTILVVGLPYNMDGTPGALAETVGQFISELERRFRRPVVGVDERLSSREAESRLRDERASGERRRRVTHGDVDATAACVILEQWLREGSIEPRNE